MAEICLGFEVHQPYRINRNFKQEYAENLSINEVFDVYFNNSWNKEVLKKVAQKCYYSATETILEKLDDFNEFKVAFSFSGVLLEQCKAWEPGLLDLFKELSKKKNVEILEQTYFHSLASLFKEKGEFIEQIKLHRKLMGELFKVKPKVFENTEFLYNNTIAKVVEELGYTAIFTEGAERILGWRSPNYVYKAKNLDIRVLLRNYRLSDDIAFRFSSSLWNEYPLTAEKFATWLAFTTGDCINLFMDYETFGEHHWKETGILEFLRWLPEEVLKRNLSFALPSELVEKYSPVGEIDVNDFSTLSWADIERDTSAWIGNDMQRTCFYALEKMEKIVKKAKSKKTEKIWRYLQISDNLYYMYTQEGAPGIVHGYFSQQLPQEVFHAFTRILSDFQEKVSKFLEEPYKSAAYFLRILPPEKAFHYYEGQRYLNLSAHSLEELCRTIPLASEESIKFHLNSKDIERWVRFTIGDKELADKIKKVKNKENLLKVVRERCKTLWKLLE